MRVPLALAAIALTCLCLLLLPSARAAADGTSGAAEVPSRTPNVHLFTVTSSDHPGTFGWTGGLAAGPDGSIYVMDLEQFRILRFGTDGRILATWGSAGRRQGQFAFGTGSANYTTATGIAVAADGTVYVADPGNDRIQHFTGDGRFLNAWGRRGSDPGAFRAPIDIAIAPTGDVFVQDAGNKRVQRFAADGAFRLSWPIAQSCDQPPNWPLGLAAAPDGSVLVGVYAYSPTGNSISAGCVLRYSPTGDLLAQWPIVGESSRGFPPYPRDIAVAADGDVFVAVGDQFIHRYDASGTYKAAHGPAAVRGVAVTPDGTVLGAGNARIERIDPSGTPIDPILSTAPPPIGTFASPSAVAMDGEGYVYVADSVDNRIQRFDPFGAFAGQWGGSGAGPGQFDAPVGLAVAANNVVYVADTGNNRIQLFYPPGTYHSEWGEAGSGPGQLDRPTGVAVSRENDVYVVDAGNQRVLHFDGRGRYYGEIGGPGSGEGELTAPVDVAVDWYGSVYVSDAGSFRIAQYGADGDFYNWLGFFGGGDGQFQAPAGIGVDPRRPADAGEAWVFAVDRLGNLLHRFTSSDRPLMAWGGGGAELGLLTEPVDVAVGPDGRVYVAEAGNSRVQVFDPSGEHLATWGSRALSSYRQSNEVQVGEGSFQGVDVTVAPDGSFYVADRDERVLHFSAAGSYLATWGYSGYDGVDGEFGDIRALAVAPDGTVHVLDRDRRIQVFTPRGEYLRAWDVVLARLPPSNVEPADLAAGPDGSLYITSRDLPRLLRFDPTGALLGEWRRWEGWGPELVAVGPSSDVYTAGHGRFAVDRFNAAGDRLGEWGSKGSGPSQFGGDCDSRYGHCRAGDLAVDRDGLVYVGDGGMGRIQRFTREGRYVDSVVRDVPPPSSLFPAFRFDVDASGPSPRLLVFDTYAGRALHVYGSEPPDNWRAEYYGNEWLAERPLLIEYRSRLDLAWDDSAPVLDMPSDGLSARFRRFVTVPPGLYRFTLTTQGSARFWVDDRLVVDAWSGRDVAATVAVPLGAARHDLLVEYHTSAKSGAVRLTWARTADLSAVYLPAAQWD